MPRDPKNVKKETNRRGNNEGSIYQRSDGRWCAQATTGYNEIGKPVRKYVYGKTRQEVAKQLTALTNSIFTSGYIQKSDAPIFVDFLYEWMTNFKKPKVTDATFVWYGRYANTHIVPVLGNMKLSSIETIHIQKLLNGMINNKYAARTVNGVRHLLGQVFRFAVQNNIIAKNPVEFTKGMSKRKEKRKNYIKALTVEQRQIVLEATGTHEFLKPMVKTLMFTGLRIGELLALQWKNIDFGKNVISVQNAIIREYDFDDECRAHNQRTLLSFTKTQASERDIVVPEIVMETLKEHLNERKLLTIRHKRSYTAPDDFVFSTREGKLRTYQGFQSMLRRFSDKCKFDFEFHAHTLRHTFATMLLEQGENPKTVQMLLGHKDIETTLGIYTHVLKEVYDQSAQKLDSAYAKLVPHKNEECSSDLDKKMFDKFKTFLSDPSAFQAFLSTKIEQHPS